MHTCTCSNKNGETPIHCAAYNERDSGPLMELMMQTCTDDIKQQALQMRTKDQVGTCMPMYIVYSCGVQGHVCYPWLC